MVERQSPLRCQCKSAGKLAFNELCALTKQTKDTFIEASMLCFFFFTHFWMWELTLLQLAHYQLQHATNTHLQGVGVWPANAQSSLYGMLFKSKIKCYDINHEGLRSGLCAGHASCPTPTLVHLRVPEYLLDAVTENCNDTAYEVILQLNTRQ